MRPQLRSRPILPFAIDQLAGCTKAIFAATAVIGHARVGLLVGARLVQLAGSVQCAPDIEEKLGPCRTKADRFASVTNRFVERPRRLSASA
jgi:hypothetical protein